MNKQTIWILEDDLGAQFVLNESLRSQYNIQFFETIGGFNKGHSECKGAAPNLIIADLRFPDGLFLTYAKVQKPALLSQVPFIIVSALDDIDVLRCGYSIGAADYLTKPFNKSELIVRVQRILGKPNHQVQLSSAGFSINYSERNLVTSCGISSELKPTEFKILTALATSPNKRLERKVLTSIVWKKTTVSTKTLDVHLVHLRRRLEPLGIRIEYVAPSSFQLSSYSL